MTQPTIKLLLLLASIAVTAGAPFAVASASCTGSCGAPSWCRSSAQVSSASCSRVVSFGWPTGSASAVVPTSFCTSSRCGLVAVIQFRRLDDLERKYAFRARAFAFQGTSRDEPSLDEDADG
jgi:hypothetical protein